MKHLTMDDFDSEIANGKVLVDFWAPWCGPCKMLAHILDQLDAENIIPICKVSTDECPDIAKRYEVMNIPTLILFKDGQPADRLVGVTDLESLKKFVI